jgi:hypothetical protein
MKSHSDSSRYGEKTYQQHPKVECPLRQEDGGALQACYRTLSPFQAEEHNQTIDATQKVEGLRRCRAITRRNTEMECLYSGCSFRRRMESANRTVTIQRSENQTMSMTRKREDLLRCSDIGCIKIKWLYSTSGTSMQASVTATFLE